MIKVFLVLAIVLALVFIFKKSAFGSEDKLLGKAAPEFKLKNSNGELVSLKEFKEKYNLPFMLLSDPDGETAKKYGALNNFFIFKLAKRQSFIIDPDGVVRRVYRDVSPSNHAQEIKTDLEAFERNS